MKLILLLSSFLYLVPTANPTSDQILGKWISEDKDLIVEVYKTNEHYAAKVVWFDCSAPSTPKMSEHVDSQNPDPKLRNRPWLGMVVVDDLRYGGTNQWVGGNIYDPNSGHTFKSIAKLTSPQQLIVRGYWGFEFLGKSLYFKKV